LQINFVVQSIWTCKAVRVGDGNQGFAAMRSSAALRAADAIRKHSAPDGVACKANRVYFDFELQRKVGT
jgi:hypothetical protein